MTFSRKLGLFVPAAFVMSLALGSSSNVYAQRTAADIESARQLYNEGIQLRDKGELKGALEKFRAAHALGNTPITGIELCKTHAALKQPVEAREVCLGVSRIPPTAQETPRSQEARNEAARIAEAEKPKMGALRIKITGVPQGWEPTVTVDGVTIPAVALGQPRAVNPGPHTITARVGTGAETKGQLETQEGETRDLEMVVAAPPANEKPIPVGGGPGQERPPPKEKKNAFPTVMFTIGGVSALIGVVGGLTAMSKEGELEDKCTAQKCGTEYHDDLDSAKTWGNVSTAFFIIAGAAVTAGLISTLASSSKSTGSTKTLPHTAKASKSGLRIIPTLGGVYGSF